MRSKPLFAVFMDMLGSMGGAFTPFVELAAGAKERRYEPKPILWMRPVSGDKYFLDVHGAIRRRFPKRDKTLSARQWRKARHAARAIG